MGWVGCVAVVEMVVVEGGGGVDLKGGGVLSQGFLSQIDKVCG